MTDKIKKKVSIYSDEENNQFAESNNLNENLINSKQKQNEEELDELGDWDNLQSSSAKTGVMVSVKQNFCKQIWPFFKVNFFIFFVFKLNTLTKKRGYLKNNV